MKRIHWMLLALVLMIAFSANTLASERSLFDILFGDRFKTVPAQTQTRPAPVDRESTGPTPPPETSTETNPETRHVESEEMAEKTPETKASSTSVQVIERPSVEKPDIIKGIYITAYTAGTKRLNELVDLLLANGGNSIVIDIEHGGGRLAFRPKNEFLKELNPGDDALNHLPELIDELHRKGIYVIARQVVFNDPYMSTRKPEWRIKNKWGGTFDYRWIDPSLPGTQNYNLYVMIEAAEMGFDEIQFDYIRFPATNHYNNDYHYDEERFTRPEIINDFLSKARKVADEYDVDLSVDVFGAIVWGNVDWKIVGQDPAEMAQYVDAIYPMTYPSHVSPGYYGFANPHTQPYDFVNQSIEHFVDKAAGQADIRTWVQGFPLKAPTFGPDYMIEQIHATYDGGGTGWIIWSPGNIYTLAWPTFKVNPPEQDLAELEQGTGTPNDQP